MKYLILTDIKRLTLFTLGLAIITSNPYKVLKEKSFSHLKLFYCENEIEECVTRVRIQGDKVLLQNGKTYDCKPIIGKFIVVCPNPDEFTILGTGIAKDIPLLSIHEDGTSAESSFLLVSKDDGPSKWTNCVYADGKLDFGGQKVIEVEALT